MRIGINTLAAVSGKQEGQSNHTYNLIESLAKIDTVNHYVLFVSPANRQYISAIQQKNVIEVICNIDTNSPYYRVLWEQLFLPKLVSKYDLQVFHSLIHSSPRIASTQSLVTVQVLISLIFEKSAGLSIPMRLFWKTIGLARIRQADHLIAVSNACKDELVQLVKINPEKISVIHNGIGEHFFRDQDCVFAKSISEETTPYILWVGVPHKHKNLPTMLKAFAFLKSRHNTPIKLMMIGPNLANSELVTQTIRELALEAEVILRPVTPNEKLPEIYQKAELFLFPSTKESFGIPVIEAMASGVPVVAANIPAIAEIAGDSALLVDPASSEAIFEGMKQALFNIELRQSLVRKGLECAKKYSWVEAATQTLAVYSKFSMGT